MGRTQKKRKRVYLQVDDIDLPMAPYQLAVSNLLPGDVEAPDWTSGTDAGFDQFLDQRFPREKFVEFRRALEGPNMLPYAAPSSKIVNYRLIILTRERWRAAAHINSIIASMTGTKRSPLRICEFCKNLFLARRNNQETCSEKCASGRRMARWRAKADEYESNRQRKKAAKEYQLRLELKGKRKSETQEKGGVMRWLRS